jgi:site-specific DNA recombinase
MSTNRAVKQQPTAAIYARVSSEEQVQGYSIQAQLRACREWAENHGYTVAKEYIEEGQSAFRNLEKREVLKELLADTISKQRAFDLIIVHKLDRLFRDTLESSTARAILKREQVRLISVTEPMVGSDTPEDFFMEHLLVGMAEFYSRNLSREIMKGLKQRALQGHLVFGPPFGYRQEVMEKQEGHKRTRIISRPVVDEKAAPVVQRIFDLYDKGMGYKSIAMTLNSDGLRTNKGHLFRVMFISRTLRNRAYIGILDYNKVQKRGPREPIAIPGFYPPIIDEKLFNRIQEKLKSESDSYQNSFAHRTEYLLSRLVVCDFCGHHYLGTSAKSGKYGYYSCQTRLRRGRDACNAPLLNKEKFEKSVLDQVQEHILSEENVRKYIDLVIGQAQQSKSEPSADELAVESALKDIEGKIRRWEETLERGLLSLEDCAGRLKELGQQRESLVRRRVELQKKSRSRATISPIPTRLMNDYIREMQRRLREKKIGYKKELLREILKEVRVRGNVVSLTYRLPMTVRTPPPEGVNSRTEEFFTLYQMVEPMGVEPTASRVRF